MSERTLRVNRPEVIDENFQDEYVIVNLKSGTYYSLNKTGTFIWDMLAQNATRARILETMQNTFDGDAQTIVLQAGKLLDELEQEQLIVSTDEAPQLTAASVNPGERRAFSPPVLEKFTDMQALLLLDPIHQVDDSGWPAAKPNAH